MHKLELREALALLSVFEAQGLSQWLRMRALRLVAVGHPLLRLRLWLREGCRLIARPSWSTRSGVDELLEVRIVRRRRRRRLND